MSLRLAIPRRVALQQSPPPLRQPRIILTEKRLFEQKKALNGKCANSSLSQRRGSPHGDVPDLCQNIADLAHLDDLGRRKNNKLRGINGRSGSDWFQN